MLRPPLCLSAFRGVKSCFYLFTYSSPLFTTLHQQTLKKLNFRMRFKYGLKTQKLLAQGVWGKTYESSIKKRYKTAATEGEEW